MPCHPVPCASCQSTASQPVWTKFNLVISRCTRCGLLYANPRLSQEEIWLRYSPDYFWKEYLPSLGITNGHFDLAHFDRRHAAMLALIARHARRGVRLTADTTGERSPAGRLFEVGAGAGFFLKAAERAGWTSSGIEVSTDGVQFATARLGLTVHQQSAESLDLAQSWDAIVMFEVIEHLLDPLRVLQTVRRGLVDGGVLAISTPNIDALSRTALGLQWAVLSPSEHLYYFSESTLSAILQRAGFQTVRFIRQHAGFGVYETMNPRYTHAPQSLRTKSYATFVSTLGPLVFRRVQALGKGDTLLCVAS